MSEISELVKSKVAAAGGSNISRLVREKVEQKQKEPERHEEYNPRTPAHNNTQRKADREKNRGLQALEQRNAERAYLVGSNNRGYLAALENDIKAAYTPTIGERAVGAVSGGAKNWLGNLFASNTAPVAAAGGTIATSVYEDELATLQKRRDALLADMSRLDISDAERSEQEWQLKQYDDRIKILNDSIRANENIGDAGYQAANEIMLSGARDIAAAKQNSTKLGSFLIDVGATTTQLVADALLSSGLNIGLGKAGPFKAVGASSYRAAGGAALEAKNEGATDEQALARGVAEFVKTWTFNKLLNTSETAKSLGGKGLADDFVDDVVTSVSNKLAKTQQGQNAIKKILNLFVSGGGEGLEEWLEKMPDPILDAITRGDASYLRQYGDKEFLSESLYDMLLGSVMGFAAPVVDVTTRGVRGAVGSITNKLTSKTQNAPTAQLNAPDATSPLTENPNNNIIGVTSTETGVSNDRIETARQMLRNGAPASQVFSETGVVVMANGDLQDGVGGTVYKGANYGEATHNAGRGDLTGYSNAGREMETLRDTDAVSGGNRAPSGQSPERVGFRQLADEERSRLISSVENNFDWESPEADALLREFGDDIGALAEAIYNDFSSGRVVAENNWARHFANPDAVFSAFETNEANALPEGMGAMSGENPTDAKPSKVGTNTLTNTPYLTAEQKQRYKPETLTYESTTNAKDMLTASERLALDYDGESDEIMQNGVQNAEDLHVAFALMFDAVQNDGETGTSARQWMEKLVEAGSTGGQIVQAFSVYAHTPEGKLVEAQRAVDAINEGVAVNPGERGVSSEASSETKKQNGKQRKAEADKVAEEVLSELDKPTSKNGKHGKTHRNAAKQASKDIIRGVVKGNTTAEMWSDIASDKIATKREHKPQQKTTPQTIMEDLVRFAATNAPDAVKRNGRTNADRVADYLANTPFYDEVWQTAKRKIREQYADNPEALAEFDRYLNHSLRESVLNTVYEAEHVARLSDNEITEIFELMQKSNAAEAGSYEANMYEAMANKIIASKLPKTFRNKLTTFLMSNMLGNIRTLLTRNAGGNLLFAVPEQASKGFATGVDALVGIATGERTHMATPNYYGEYFKGFAKGAKDATRDFANRVQTPKSGEALDYAAQYDPFKREAFNFANRLVQYGLDVGDRPFYEANYAARMAELNRIKSKNNLSGELAANFDALAPLEARAFALDSVFQSNGKTAQGLGDLKSAIQKVIQGTTGISLGGQFSVPFTRTPGGMLERTAEYLPVLGTVKNAITTGKELASGEFNQARFSMESGRNLTGLLAAGASVGGVLSGLITAGSYGDDDEKTKEQSGWQEYSIKIGDKYYSYDWIPILGSIMGGVADAVDAFQNAESGSNAFLKGVSAGLGTVTEMSAMQGLNRMFGGYNSTVQGFGNMLLEGTSQLVPSLVRQTAIATDEYARQTYDPNIIVQQWNRIRSAFPVLRETLPVLYDMYGDPVKQNQDRSIASKLLENMLSPGTLSETNDDPRTNILLQIAEEGFGTDPSATPKKVKDLTLSAQEYNQFSKTSGTTFGDIMDAFVGNARFDALSTDSKSLLVNEAQEYASDVAKREFMKGRGQEYESDWDDESKLPTNVLADVLLYRRAVNDVNKDDAKPENFDVIDALIADYGTLSRETQTELAELDTLPKLIQAADAGIKSETFFQIKDGFDAISDDDDDAGKNNRQFAQWLEDAGWLTPSHKAAARELFKDYTHIPGDTQRYDELTAIGFTGEKANTVVDAVTSLGSDIPYWQKAQTITGLTGLSDSEKWDAVIAYNPISSGDKDKAATARYLDVSLSDFTTAIRLIEAADANSSDEIVDVLKGMNTSKSTKSKLYALFTTTKKKGGKNPFGKDYSDTLTWQYAK